MKSIICTTAALLLFVLLAGCGQSGDLFVPGDPSSIQVPPTAASDEEEKNDGEDDDSQ
jgi:predicted small lipoprotein YifL